MKRYFFTGLILILPLFLTIAVVMFLVNLLTAPFIDLVQPWLSGFLKDGFLFLSQKQILLYGSKVIILLFLFFTTVLLGFLTQWMIIHYFINLSDAILHRIPLVNSIYKTTKEVINTIFGSDNRSFKQVAMVPFPSSEVRSVGLVTREHVPGLEDKNLVVVFVPTTPNPTSGFMIFFKRDQVTYLDMSVEEALKYIISCGVVNTEVKGASGEVIR